MTIPPPEWGEEEYCAFYSQSTTCSKTSIESYACVPQCLTDCSDVFCDSMSTLVYSCDPTVKATYRNKTAVESQCLYSYSSNAPTQTIMSFSSSNTFDGVSPSEMDTATSRSAAIAAMAMSISGVPADQITIESITGSEARRSLDLSFSLNSGHSKTHHEHEDIRVQVASANVVYKINAVLEALGYSESSSSAAYSSLTNQISTSVVSGQFQQNLKAAGESAGVQTFKHAEVTKIPSYSTPELVLLVTSPPTGLPTGQPTRRKSSSSAPDDDVAPIAGGVIGGFFALLLIALVIYYCFNQARRQALEEKFRTHNFINVKAQTDVESGNKGTVHIQNPIGPADEINPSASATRPASGSSFDEREEKKTSSFGEKQTKKSAKASEMGKKGLVEDFREKNEFL